MAFLGEVNRGGAKVCSRICLYQYQKKNPNKGTFKKGIAPWNKGTIGICKSNSGSLKKGNKVALGKHWKIKDTSKMNKDKIGKKRPPFSQEWKDKISKAKKGENAKEKHWNWKGGISKDVHSISEPKYKEWRKSVFERDNYTCQKCFLKGIYIEAHHIKSWAKYPELRYEISNGLTLCRECHKLTDNYKGKK